MGGVATAQVEFFRVGQKNYTKQLFYILQDQLHIIMKKGGQTYDTRRN